MDIVFMRPSYLWFMALLPALVIIHFYSLRHVERKALLFANFKAMRRITGGEPVPKNYVLLGMRLATLAAFIFSVSGATVVLDIPASAYDFVVALDSSNSMSAPDIQPDRMTATIEETKNFVSKLPPSASFGVVSFSSTAILLAGPNQQSKEDSIKKLESITVSQIGGTAIGDAIITATNALIPSGRQKTIILLTDGESNTGVRMEDAGQYAAHASTKVFAIGIGSNEEGATVNMASLENLAIETNGKAFRARTHDELKQAFDNIVFEQTTIKDTIELTLPLMAVAFLLVLLDWAMSSTRYRIIP